SLTAGQAFLAFVLLLLSLAAAFAFGLLIGRGQADDKLNVRKDAAVLNEASPPAAKLNTRNVDVAVKDDDFKAAGPAKLVEETTPVPVAPPRPAPVPAASSTAPASAAAVAVPHYAQVLSTSDQKTAEGLAAKLIDGGFNSAYVERIATAKGTVYRVRVRFPSETEARAAVAKLSTYSKDVWITK
ncbi:MAG: SPOR domain-containing protein, partial [Thermoanaerobaculia bacterium]